MNQEELLQYIKNELNYTVSCHSGNKTVYQFSNYFNRDGKHAENIDDVRVSIGLEVKFVTNENESLSTMFTFIYVTAGYSFRFHSGEYSNILRNDFTSIELAFVGYCIKLKQVDTLNY